MLEYFSPEEKPYGFSFGEWTAKWWQWVLSIPKEKNPGIDDTGEKFTINNDPNVVFLVGTFGGSAKRNYAIPSCKSVLFPIINFTTSYIEEPELKTESDLKERAKHDIDDIAEKDFIIDGLSVKNVQRFRIQSPIFDVTYCDNNIFGLRSGTTKAISDGYWIFLKPLQKGKHDIQAAGACSLGKTQVSITWHLNVV